jgi:acylphosphatase
MKKIHIFYSGNVQGIGFRYIAKQLADKYRIVGWIKNTADDKVELVALGEEKILKDFLNKINQNFSGYIKDVNLQWQESAGEFKDFSVKFD